MIHQKSSASAVSLCLVATLAILAVGCAKKPVAKPSECSVDPAEKPILDAESAGCILIVDGALLVTRVAGHGKDNSGKVTPPGGTVRDGESARCAAVRQTKEETGLDVKAGTMFAIWRNNFHLFMCQLVDPKDMDKARSPEVPEEIRGDIKEKLLLELPSMKNRKTGSHELWAFPSNVVITADWQAIKGLAVSALPKAASPTTN